MTNQVPLINELGCSWLIKLKESVNQIGNLHSKEDAKFVVYDIGFKV